MSTSLPPPRAQLLVAFAAMVAASSALEAVWYLRVARDLYDRHLGSLLKEPFDLPVAVVFYLVYGLGALVFALRPALQEGSLRRALAAGAAYGFFCFSAHNLTDLADVRGYDASIAAVDIAWGACMSGAAASFAFLAAHRLVRSSPVPPPA